MALVCLVWGEEFADFFARYCVPSLLEPHNLPLASREQDVTFLLYTDRGTQELLDGYDSFKALSRFAKVELLPLEQFPPAARTNHWVPWQHAVAGRSRDFDRFLIIIPDCVYAAGCLATIIDALEGHDTVYYTLPQVCRETVAVELDRLRRVDAHEYIGFTSLQAVELFIRHVNPKHAAASCSGTSFINHPEYAIELSTDGMVVSETASHPLAVRSGISGTSYTFDALSPGAKARYLEILGVSAEPATKFVEQYYRWPKLHRDHSRLMNLGSWASNFRTASIGAYSKSAAHITLGQGRVLEQQRGRVERPKTRFINATLDFLAAATRVYARARALPDDTAAKHIALVMAAPGFHRHLRSLQSGLTVVLPRTASGFQQVVDKIESHPAATAVLRRFLLLHVVAHQLPIAPGHAVFLTHSDESHLPKAFVVDPNTIALGAGLWVKAVSPPQCVRENVFCLVADIDYTHLTWSVLDTASGTSQPVLDHPRSFQVDQLHNGGRGTDLPDGVPRADCSDACIDSDGALVRYAPGIVLGARNAARFGVVRAYHAATKLPLLAQSAWLVRNLYRKARGRAWLCMEDAGVNAPGLRLAKREARRLREVVSKICRGPRGQSPAEPELSIPRELPLTESARASYDAISKLNIIDDIAKVTLAFYERLGLSPEQSPAYRCLASVRAQLVDEVEAHGAVSAGSPLERFEFAWRAYEAGRTDEAFQLFREVTADERLAEASAADPRAREALIRAAEILGRHAELRGDISTAARLYRRLLEHDGNGIVARRLLLMLWREGRIREAAELAPRVVGSDSNLVQHLRGSNALADLARRLGREARRESTTARGQNAGDFGLQAR